MASSMMSHQRYLAQLAASNHQLADDIDDFAKTQQGSGSPNKSEDREVGARVAAFLDQIYAALCSMKGRRGHMRTPNKAILAAWTSFFRPIRSLTGLPSHGYFLAARMTLYLTSAFLQEDSLHRKFPETESSIPKVAELHSFLGALDVQLLECLRNIWESSNLREEFSWVFSPYPVNDENEDTLKAGVHQATSPAILAALGGINGRRIWFPEPGGTPIHERDPAATRCVYRKNSQGELVVLWQQYGDDGPIREDFHYYVVDADNGNEQFRQRQALRRSRQFIFDARRFAQPLLAKDRQQLAEQILDASPLALETKLQILSYMDEPISHPYLSNLDLAQVYSPFPRINQECSECGGRKHSKLDHAKKQTCPQASLTIWNLALRAFHTFHQVAQTGDWLMCRNIGCQGHHTEFTWAVREESELLSMVDAIVSARCGPGADLQSIGLGPADQLFLPSEEADNKRKELMFNERTPLQDAEEDAKMSGGIAGLTHAMLHGKTLLGCWQGQSSGGRTRTDPTWCLGRTKSDEGSCQRALMALHMHCELC